MTQENTTPKTIAPAELKEVVGGMAQAKGSDCCIARSLYAPSTSASS
jgi:hypothetical protein